MIEVRHQPSAALTLDDHLPANVYSPQTILQGWHS